MSTNTQSRGWYLWLGVAIGGALASAVSLTLVSTNCAIAQITPDATLPNNSTVKLEGNTRIIEGGTQAGSNLFHSFREFSVPTGSEAHFNNVTDIENIISRVTGGSISNIDGLIRASGTANLFLINPSGIVFGPNASLNVGGSFLASTASSFKFRDGSEFSATNPQAPSLLTINVLIGLQYGGQQQKAITFEGQPSSELRVAPKRSINLLGGNVSVNQFNLFAPGGQIEIAGVSGAGTVGLLLDDNDVRLIPNNLARADVSLSQAGLDIEAEGGGNITIEARNLDMLNSYISSLTNGEGDAGSILLQTDGSISLRNSGVNSVTYGQGNSGNISLKANDSISFENSSISSSTPSGLGDAGRISLQANGSISFVSGGIFSDVAYGQGAGGSISLEADGSILITKEATFDSEAISDRSGAGSISLKAGDSIVISERSSIYSNTGGKGDAGKINIQAGSFSLINGSQLASTTSGEGKGGNIEINATDFVNLSGLYPFGSLLAYSRLLTNTVSGATGDAGDIKITTKTLQLSDAAVLNAGTNANANGGDVSIDVNTLEIRGGGKILTSTFSDGNAGNITLNATEKINISGIDPNYFTQQPERINYYLRVDHINSASGLFSNTNPNSTGNGGTIDLNTRLLSLADGAQVVTSTAGSGKAGDIYLGSRDYPIQQITLQGANTGLFASTQASLVTLPLTDAKATEIGDAGQLPTTAQLIPTVPGTVVRQITGSLNSTNDVDLYQIELEGNQTFWATTFLSNVFDTRLFLFDSKGSGIYFNDDINDQFLQSTLPANHPLTPTAPGVHYLAVTQYPLTPISNGGEIFGFQSFTAVNSKNELGGTLPLSGWLGNGFEQGNYTIRLTGVSSIPLTLPGGDGGNIMINAGALSVRDGAQLAAITTGSGKAGNIQVSANQVELLNGGQLLTTTSGSGSAGKITVNATDKVIVNSTDMTLNDQVAFPIRVSNSGTASGLFVLSNSSGTAGDIEVTSPKIQLEGGRFIAESASGNGGNIILQVGDILLLRRRSLISATAGTQQQGGDGGNITINAPSGFIVAVPRENSNITANAFQGSGGKVQINATGIFGMTVLSREDLVRLSGTNDLAQLDLQLFPSSITAISQTSPTSNGQVTLNTPDVDPSRGLVQLPTNLVDASGQIDQSCTPGSRQVASSFIVTGRGGLPLSPTEPLQDSTTLAQWVRPRAKPENPPKAQVEKQATQVSTTPQVSPDAPIVEANGWVVDANGDILLVAQAPNVSPHSPWQKPTSCTLPQ